MKNQLRWLQRDAGYIFWVLTEQIAYLALPRLLLFPLAAYIIGKEGFGIFLTALSVTLILGIQPQNGLGTGILRHLSDCPDEKKPQFFGTAMRMCHPAMVIIVVVGLLGTAIAGFTNLVPWVVLHCLIPLVISLYPENQFWLILTEKRFLRHFRNRAIWFTLRSFSSVIFGIIGALTAGAIGLAWGFMAGNAIVYIILRFRCQAIYQTPYNMEIAGVLKSVWLQVTLAGIIAVSGPYLNRLILSAFHTYEDVADIVAATSVIFLFLTPLICCGSLLLSMISKYSSIKQFTRRGKILWLSMLLCGVLGLPVIAKLFGPFVLQLMFPKFGEISLKLLHILVVMVASESVISLMRPFVVKFASTRLLPIINGAGMASTLIPAVLLIPKYGVTGAAWAIVIGNVIFAASWSLAAIRVLIGKKEKDRLAQPLA